MSSSNKNSGQTKYANSNLNSVLSSKSSTTGQSSTGGTINRFNGMLVLQKKGRTGSAPKLAVPKPVNLPSMRKEHAGNDPTTQLVPSGTGSGWSKPEEHQAPTAPQEIAPRPAPAAPGAPWAASQRPPAPAFPAQLGAAWQPPAAAAAVTGPRPSYPVDRHLNPEEYPSLAATARAAAAGKQATKQPGPDQQQDLRSWADDERAPPSGAFRGPGEWNGREGDVYEDDRYLGGRPGDYGGRGSGWDLGYREQRGRYQEGPYGGRPYSGYEDDFDFRGRGHEPYGRGPMDPPPPPPRRGPDFDRPYEAPGYRDYPPYEDRPLFPPPPPARQPPPPPKAVEPQPPSEEEDEEDLERKAFEAELQKVAADLEKRKHEDRSDSVAEKRPPPATEDEGEREMSLPGMPGMGVPPPPPPPPPPPRTQPSQAAMAEAAAVAQANAGGAPAPAGASESKEDQAARNAAKAARLAEAARLRQLQEEEEEKRRKDAAAAKLKQLEAQMAARNAAEVAIKGPAARPKVLKDLNEEKELEEASKQAKEETKEPGSRTASVTDLPKGLPPKPADYTSSPAHHQAPVNHWQQPLGKPITAMFGSFDEGLLEELNRAPPPQQQQQQQQVEEEAKPVKPWRPAEGTTPQILSHHHAPAAPAEPRPASGDTRVDLAGRGPRELGAGRGRGRFAASSSEHATPDGTDSDVPSEARGRGRGRGAPPGMEPGRGRGRGGRAGRGRGDMAWGLGEDSKDGSENPSESTSETGFVEVKHKREKRSRDSTPTTAESRPRLEGGRGPAPGRGRGDQGGRGMGRGGRGQPPIPPVPQPPAPPPAANTVQPEAPTAPTAAAPAAAAPTTAAANLNAPKQPGLAPSGPLAGRPGQPGKAPPGAPGLPGAADHGALSWNAAHLAKEVVKMTLDDPVTTDLPSMNLPATLDLNPVVPANTPPIPIGPASTFLREVGAKLPPGGKPNEAPKQDVLDHGMPALPADLNLDVVPSPPKQMGFQPAPGPSNPMQGGIRPMGLGVGPGGFSFAPAPDGNHNAAAGPASLSMWDQANTLGGFGQHPNPLQHQQLQSHQANLASAMQSFYSPGPGSSMFPNNTLGNMGSNNPNPSSQSLQGAPPPMMLGLGQFGQSYAPFPRPFGPPQGFGNLGFGAFTPQPFLPTNKQPDWSTGAGPIGINQPGALNMNPLARLDLGAPYSLPGPNNDNSQSGFQGVNNPLVGQGLPSLAPNTFAGPGLKQGPGNQPNLGSPMHKGVGQQQPAPGVGQIVGFPGQPQQQQMQQQQQQAPGQAPGVAGSKDKRIDANLPEDIFGLDLKPAVGPAGGKVVQPPPPPPSNGPAGQAPAPGQRMGGPAGGGQNAQPPPPPPGRDVGPGPKPGRGRGRDGPPGGRGDGGRDGGRHGFAGRNGRGAGRTTVAVAPVPGAQDAMEQQAAAAANAMSNLPGQQAPPAGPPGGGRGPPGESGRGGRGRGPPGGGRGGRGAGRGPQQAGMKMVYVPKGSGNSSGGAEGDQKS